MWLIKSLVTCDWIQSLAPSLRGRVGEQGMGEMESSSPLIICLVLLATRFHLKLPSPSHQPPLPPISHLICINLSTAHKGTLNYKWQSFHSRNSKSLRDSVPETKDKNHTLSNITKNVPVGFSGGSVVKKPPCECRRHRFDPWSQKTPHATDQLSLCTTTAEPVP